MENALLQVKEMVSLPARQIGGKLDKFRRPGDGIVRVVEDRPVQGIAIACNRKMGMDRRIEVLQLRGFNSNIFNPGIPCPRLVRRAVIKILVGDVPLANAALVAIQAVKGKPSGIRQCREF